MYAALLSLLIYALGWVHVVSSSQKSTMFVRKIHWTLAETFVSYDAITNMPYVSVMSSYPLSVKALQRVGYLESDVAREARIHSEVQDAAERIKTEIKQQMETSRLAILSGH